MSSIEALWTAQFGDVTAPGNWVNGGVVVFESGRLFGGDGGTYYVGDYACEGGKLGANFKTARYDPTYRTAFGGTEPLDIVANGSLIGEDRIEGSMTATEHPGLKISFVLTRRAQLP